MPVHSFQVGAFNCKVIQDGGRGGDVEMLKKTFAAVPPDEIETAFHALPPEGQLWSYNPLFIDTGEHQILVDTGFGAATPSPDYGKTLPSLQAEGIPLESIDTIIITHAHGDHVSGLVDADGKLVFPQARIVVWKGEWDYWLSPESLARFQPEQVERVQRLAEQMKPNLVLLDSEQEILPGVSAVSMPGHTPGHMGLLVESNGEGLLPIVDTAHSLMQMAHPEWSPHFDSQPELSARTRRQIFEKAADENLLMLAYHFPFPGLGHVARARDAYAWKPI